MTPDQLRGMSGTDYAHLSALHASQPWGAERDNYHVGMLLAQNANFQTRTKRSDPVIHPSRFMLGLGKKEKDADEKVQLLRAQIHEQIAKQTNGK